MNMDRSESDNSTKEYEYVVIITRLFLSSLVVQAVASLFDVAKETMLLMTNSISPVAPEAKLYDPSLTEATMTK